MEEEVKEIKFVISDLHLGEGWQNYFKYQLEAFDNDLVFKHFIEMIVKRYAYANKETKVTLILNGDTFDPLAVVYKGESQVIPVESVDVYKMKRIIQGHPIFFNALAEFLSHNNFNLQIVIGNHDLFLHWPLVQKTLIRRLGEKYSSRISFVTSILENKIYITHGNSEYHNQSPAVPIVKELTLVPFKRGWLKKMLIEGELLEEKMVLDVPLGHYLVTNLQNPLKKYNSLIGHMRHNHGFVWLNALFGLGRKTWYRKHRLFGVIAVLTGIWIMIKFWWYQGNIRIVKKIFQVLWWTITGVLEGQTSRDEAKRILERDDVDAVIFGHEHVPCFETIRVGVKNKLYVNSGTWQLIREVKVIPIETKWRYGKRLERIYRRIKRFLKFLFNPVIEDITEFPVVEIVYKNESRPLIQLLCFNDSKRELEKL